MSFNARIAQKEPGVFNVALTGPLDTATYVIFEKHMEPLLISTTKVIILDMAGVNYISSMGIGSVFKINNMVTQLSGKFLIVNLQPQIKKVFETVKALPASIFKSVEEADEYLSEIQKKALKNNQPPL